MITRTRNVNAPESRVADCSPESIHAAPPPPARQRTRILLGIGLTVAVLTGLTGLWATANAAGAAYFVSPTGADTNPGTSAAAPFRTIQKALDLAAAGSTITLAPGVYRESIVTKTAGTAASPITVKGPETGKDASGRYQAVLAGKGTGGYVVSINHSNYAFDGFTVDGQPGIDRTEYPTVPGRARGRSRTPCRAGRSTPSWSTSAPTSPPATSPAPASPTCS